MSTLPRRFYGDPSDNIDELRKLRQVVKRKTENERLAKQRRISKLVKQVIANGGGTHGK